MKYALLAAVALSLSAVSVPAAQASERPSGSVDVIGAVRTTGDATAKVRVRYRCSASDYAGRSGAAGLTAQVRTPTGYEWLYGGRFSTSYHVARCDGRVHTTAIPVSGTLFGTYTPISKGERARVYVGMVTGCTYTESNPDGVPCSYVDEDNGTAKVV